MSGGLRRSHTEEHHAEGDIPAEARRIVPEADPEVLRILDLVTVLHMAVAVHNLLVEVGKGSGFAGGIGLERGGNDYPGADSLAEEDIVLSEGDNNPREEAAAHAEAAVHVEMGTGLGVDTGLAEDTAVGAVGRTGPDSLAGRRGKTSAI